MKGFKTKNQHIAKAQYVRVSFREKEEKKDK